MKIESEEQLRRLVSEGWHPYYMKSVKRWYLRKGQKRHIIARELEPLARALAEKERREKEARSIPVGWIQDLRREGRTIEGISESLGISRSTVYRALERRDGEAIKPRARKPETRTQTRVPEMKSEKEETKEREPSRLNQILSREERRVEEGSSNLNHMIVLGMLFGLGMSPIAFQIARAVLEGVYYADGIPGVPRVSEEIELKPPEEEKEEPRDVWLNLT